MATKPQLESTNQVMRVNSAAGCEHTGELVNNEATTHVRLLDIVRVMRVPPSFDPICKTRSQMLALQTCHQAWHAACLAMYGFCASALDGNLDG